MNKWFITHQWKIPLLNIKRYSTLLILREVQIKIKYCISPLSWQISKVGNWQYHRRKEEREVAQSCLTLCNPIDCSLAGSSIHRIFQERVLEWVAISFSRGSSQPRDQTQVSRIAGRCRTVSATREAKGKALICFWWELPSKFYGGQFGNISIINTCAFWYSRLLLGIYLTDKLAHTGSTAFVQDYSL